jgi:hypothetical protein
LLPKEARAQTIREELWNRRDIVNVASVHGVYIVNTPYSNLLEVSNEQIIQEANPWAVFGFLTAMIYHGITDLDSKMLYPIAFKGGEKSSRIPPGTTPDDWTEENQLLSASRPINVRDGSVTWTQLSSEPDFGVIIGQSHGIPIYVTDLERTLVDSIRMPEKAGGIENVVRAWRNADGFDVDKLVAYTYKYGSEALRRRVGYVLETLGKTHPQVATWRNGLKRPVSLGRGLQRGGSVRLVTRNPFAEPYSAEWNLSLNVAPKVLAIMEEK